MRLNLDSSALVKLYVDEKHSDRVWDLVAAADGLWTASITYAEVRAAFSRRQREGSPPLKRPYCRRNTRSACIAACPAGV